MEITLKQLLAGTGAEAPECSVTGVAADSRQVTAGSLFVAVRGTNVDGHDYIDRAIASGAKAVVCSTMPADCAPSVHYICLPDTAKALGVIASNLYGNPSARLTLVGVTGTNGKTTIATLLYEMARMTGQRAGLLSTVVNKINDTAIDATHTTPDPLTLNRLLRQMVDAGCTFAAMEVSSHAADQQRIAGLTFAGGIFTNLTRDHLDYHKTFAAYLRAKQKFFDMLPAEAFALTNADDRNGQVLVQNTHARRFTYSLRSEADFRGRVIENHLMGMVMSFNGKEVHTRFCGRFNAANLTAVFGAASLLWPERTDLLTMISRLEPVAGRFQPITSPNGITAIVDYAHTPDALVNVLDTIRDIVGREHSIITVCGCGGDRDRGKRPIMAAEAARRSNALILTSDNPRTEDPEAILDEMAAGLPDDCPCQTKRVTDRRQAIELAARMAQPGDVILVAGKGHEDYQIIGTVKHRFDDREEVTKALNINN